MTMTRSYLPDSHDNDKYHNSDLNNLVITSSLFRFIAVIMSPVMMMVMMVTMMMMAR